MSKFLNKLRSRQQVKKCGQDIVAELESIPVCRANRIISESKAHGKKIAIMTYEHVKADKVRHKLNYATTALANVFMLSLLCSQFGFSANKCCEYNKKLTFKSECVDEGYVEYKDIVTYEIRSTDKEYSPIKWTGYSWGGIPNRIVHQLADSAFTDREKFINGTYAHALAYTDNMFCCCEIMTLSALHDYFGFGLKRCQRLVDGFRKLLYSTYEEVLSMLDMLAEKGIGIHDEEREFFKENEWAFRLVLRPAQGEEECLKNRKISDSVEKSCGGSIEQYMKEMGIPAFSVARELPKEPSSTMSPAVLANPTKSARALPSVSAVMPTDTMAYAPLNIVNV